MEWNERQRKVLFKYSLVFLVASFPLIAGAKNVEEKAKNELSPEQIDERIVKYRTAEATLRVVGPDGKPLAKCPVEIAQVRHKFLFGCGCFMEARNEKLDLHEAYCRRFAALFNYATLPFYWNGYEPQEGKPRSERVHRIAAWCRENNIITKGHPLVWHTSPPKWLYGKPATEIEKLQWARVTREVKEFKGLIDIWDVLNEPVVLRQEQKRPDNPNRLFCMRIGRIEMIRRAFEHARKANPSAMLILNDFTLNEEYEGILWDCLSIGVPIDTIGLQSHMHREYWGPGKLWETCQRFANYSPPLHFTELTILSGKLKGKNQSWDKRRADWPTTTEGEKRQATQTVELYKLLFSHPAVEAITWWNLSDFRAWQGAPAGLIRKDMSPKPAYEQLLKLIKKEWWTGPLKLTTDKNGQVRFRGFLGEYTVKSDAGAVSFKLDKHGKMTASVTLSE